MRGPVSIEKLLEEFFANQGEYRHSAHQPEPVFEPYAHANGLPLLRAYIDETGDRGLLQGNSSPIFGMASVIVSETAERSARHALRQLRSDFNVPDSRPLSWKDDLKRSDRRIHAANTLADVNGLMVIYVVADKASLSERSYVSDRVLFYNVVSYATLERTLWAARLGRTEPHQIEIRFGHVAKHPDADTRAYFKLKQDREQRPNRVPYGLMTHLSWVNASQFEMSQVADLYAGFLKAATWPSEYGHVDGSLLTKIWHQIRKPSGCPISLGFQFRPDDQLARDLDWWACACTRCKKP